MSSSKNEDTPKVNASEEEYYDEGDVEYEDEWEVEKLLGKRRNKETKEEEFMVLWAGFDADTMADGSTSWETKCWLEAQGYDDLVVMFEKQAKAEAAQKQKQSEGASYKVAPVAVKKKALGSWWKRYMSPNQPPGLVKQEDEMTKCTQLLKSCNKLCAFSEGTELSEVAEIFVNTFEGNFLRGNVVESTITRILGQCNWNVQQAWTKQLDTVYAKPRGDWGVEEEKLAAALDMEDGEARVLQNSKDDDDKVNFFMVAPTTFYESADILLVIMSFSGSRTFFNSCQVNKRWHHVGRDMSEVRRLVRNFSLGIQRNLSCCGALPISIASADTSTAMLKTFLRQADRELKDPAYDGRNGGELVPLYNLVVDDVNDYAVHVGAEKINISDRSGNGRATVLDPGLPPTISRNGNRDGEETLCLSVGRLPTKSSADRVTLVSPAGAGLTFGEGYKECGVRTDVNYHSVRSCTCHELVVPVLYIRVVWLKDDNFRHRLSSAMSSGWESEVGQSIPIPPIEYSQFDTEGGLREKDRQQRQTVAKVVGLWDSFFFSLPPPAMLWQSFASVAVHEGQPYRLWNARTDFDVFDASPTVKQQLDHSSTRTRLSSSSSTALKLFKSQLKISQKKVLGELNVKFA